MDDEFEDFGAPPVNTKDIADLKGHDRHLFINTVYEDYEFTLAKKMNPGVIRYYRDVLVTLIKTYGH